MSRHGVIFTTNGNETVGKGNRGINTENLAAQYDDYSAATYQKPKDYSHNTNGTDNFAGNETVGKGNRGINEASSR